MLYGIFNKQTGDLVLGGYTNPDTAREDQAGLEYWHPGIQLEVRAYNPTY